MYLFKLVVSFVILVLFLSCEKEIVLEQEEIKPRIVVNGIFAANADIIVHLSESRDVLYNGDLPNIENATVKLLDANNNEIGNFIHIYDGNYRCYDYIPEVGTTYGLRAEAPGLTTVTSFTQTSSLTSITSVNTLPVVDDELEFDISFMDDAFEDNFYSITMESNRFLEDFDGELSYFTVPYFTTKEIYVNNGKPDATGERFGVEFLFSDREFNGETIHFKCRQVTGTNGLEGEYHVIRLNSLSEDLYKYKISYSKYVDTDGDVFAEPVQLYSNITDGFGIFGGSSVDSDTIWVE